MKLLIVTSLVLLVAVSASAQLENSIGMFFSESEFTRDNTNYDPVVGTPFDAWTVLLNPTVGSVGGYEASFAVDPSLIALAVDGPNGWTNFGSQYNHLVGYQTPVITGGDAVLGHFLFIYLVPTPSDIFMGPSSPSSVGGAGPAIADGGNPDILLVCNYTSGPGFGGLVATLNGAGIDFPVATQERTLSDVKALFD
jgi:hypothetical protein